VRNMASQSGRPNPDVPTPAESASDSLRVDRRKRKRRVFSRRKATRITRIILIAAAYTAFIAMLIYIWVRIAYAAN